ncbi:MAG: hypothetical protein ABIY55_28060 [Kofleriaceae bacterium]
MNFDSQSGGVGNAGSTKPPIDVASAPGKSTLTSAALPKTTQDVMPTSGALPRQYGAGPTGHPAIDQEPVCDTAPAGEGCFLDAGKRVQAIAEFRGRVDRAFSAYLAALGSVKLDALLKKDEDLSWVASMVLDVISAHTLTLVTKIAGAAMKQLPAMAKLDERSIQMHLKGFVDAAKKGCSGTLKGEKNAAANASKGAEQGWFKQLAKSAQMAFQQISEAFPMMATDAELLTLSDSFDATNTYQGVYEELLTAKLVRFKDSGIDKIGKHAAGRFTKTMGEDSILTHNEGLVERERKVVRAEYASGHPVELIYRDQDDDGLHVFGVDNGYRRFKPDLSQKPIPQEFWEAATARHEEIWGAPPEAVKVDDSDYYWEPLRAAKARANNRANNPFKVAANKVEQAHAQATMTQSTSKP